MRNVTHNNACAATPHLPRLRRAAALIKQANDNAETFEITSPHGTVFLVPEAEQRSMQETAYLLRSPATARALRRSIAEANRDPHDRPRQAQETA
ncbi:MAG: type II toxin-antitoxin system Phd/YefM family antitoxin [Actinomycetes bacterium]